MGDYALTFDLDYLSPLKLCHVLVSSGVDDDGTEKAFRRRYFATSA